MFCVSCGAPLVAGSASCTQCGRPAPPAAVSEVPPIVRRPLGVTLLAIYDFAAVCTVLGLALALSLFLLRADGGGKGLVILAIVLALIGALRLAAGLGMLTGAAWARVLHIVLSVLSLLSFPIGTGVAIVSFIYLTRPAIGLWFAKKDPSTWTAEESAVWRRSQANAMSPATATALAVALAVSLAMLIPFIGLVAAIAIPNFLNAVDRAKQKRTITDLRAIAAAIEAYAVDNDAYPALGGGWRTVDALAPMLEPAYVRSLPGVDGWERPFQVRLDGTSYTLASHGKDGVPDVPEYVYSDADLGPTNTFESDIVFSQGRLVRYPQGTQN